VASHAPVFVGVVGAVGAVGAVGGGAVKKKRARPKKKKSTTAKEAEEEEGAAADEPGLGDDDEEGSDFEQGELIEGDEESLAQRKRQRILQLATQLACETDEGERRDALIQQLMRVTRGDSAASGALHFKPFAQWELHDGAASDGSANGSVKTEALHSPSGTLDLERGVDDLIAAAASRASSVLSTSASAPPAAHGLKLDLKLLDGNTVEMTGDVVVTTDGMAVTPSGMGFTPMNGPGTSVAAEDQDWFSTYSAGQMSSGGAAADMGAEGAALAGQQTLSEVASLSPLLTPSNNKLCAAIVDAF